MSRLNNPVRYFIADIHLSDSEPVADSFNISAGFFSFLETLPKYSELYILGDLFDYWVGDDVNSKLQNQVADALKLLSQRHIKKYFVHGNRDFLLGKRFADSCDMILLSDINCLAKQNGKIVFLHGDLLCTDDHQYQKFRKVMHNRWLQKLFLMMPLFIRLKIAEKLRQQSRERNQVKSAYIMDVNQQTVVSMMKHYHADIMVHGHTHKPAVHDFLVDNKPVKRFVLGAWHDGISYIKQEKDSDQLNLYNHSCK